MKKLAQTLTLLSFVQTPFIWGDAPQEMEWNPNPTPRGSAFNAPSRVEVKNPCNFFFNGNFIFWSPLQENMELGIVAKTSDPAYLRGGNGNIVRQEADFAPGFQVGVGGNFDYDSWDMFAQYTWLRNTDTVTTSLDADDARILVPFWMKPEAAGPTFFKGKEKWHLALDLVDVELGRSYYTGTKLTFRPFFGFRAAFIRQSVDVDYLNETTGQAHFNTFVDQNTHSWGLGPRGGLGMNWLLGHGIRMYGNGSADILYTQYTTLSYKQHSTTASGAVPAGSRLNIQETNQGYLRTHLALDLGFGWGNYFHDDRYHFDLSAGYTFQVFFNQNMFRTYFDDGGFHSAVPSGDLFIQGLTTSVRFDF